MTTDTMPVDTGSTVAGAAAPTAPTWAPAPPTVYELDLAWAAVRSGRFREEGLASPLRLGASTCGPTGLVVTVVGAHGWSGASTTALLLAEAAARHGEQVRLLDVADPVRSGLVGAAVTEHGHDDSGQWRCGARSAHPGPGQVRIERLDQRIAGPASVPSVAAAGAATLTVVDAGWPLADLLRLAQEPAQDRHWLGQLIRVSALVLTARASVPGVQRLAAAAAELDRVRDLDQPRAMALVGAHRLPRLLSEVVAASLPGTSPSAADPGQVVLLPGARDLAIHGVTSSDLPRQLSPAGMRLLRMAGHQPSGGPGLPRPEQRRHRGARR